MHIGDRFRGMILGSLEAIASWTEQYLPEKKMDGMIGFEVPKDWKTMEIHFKDDVWSNSKFKFEIEK